MKDTEPIVNMSFLACIEADLNDGGRRTFDSVFEAFKESGQSDLFALAESAAIKVDINVTGPTVWRLSMFRYYMNQDFIYDLSICHVNENSHQISDSWNLNTYFDKDNKPKRMLTVTPLGSDSGNLNIRPSKLSEELDRAMKNLKTWNWRLTSGRESVPEGLI